MVQGEQDAIVNAESQRQLIERLRGQPTDLIRLPQQGHALITPAVLKRVLTGWRGPDDERLEQQSAEAFGASAQRYNASARLQQGMAWQLAMRCRHASTPSGLWVDLEAAPAGSPMHSNSSTLVNPCFGWTEADPC